MAEFNSYQLLNNLQQHVSAREIVSEQASALFRLQATRDDIREFLTVLATCHTVVPEITADSSSPADITYQASSPGRTLSCKAFVQ